MKTWFEKLPFALVRIGKENRWLKHLTVVLLSIMAAGCEAGDAVKTLRHPKMQRRILASVLAFCMIFSLMPTAAFATESAPGLSSVCTHHTEHTVECGYREEVAGTPCTHEHTEDCDQEVTDCTHTHTEDCYGAEIATDSDAEAPVSCTHECGEETGCIAKTEDCIHTQDIHDAACGYVAGTEGTACGFVCDVCNQAPEQKECTCPPVDSGEVVHIEGCPLYEKPAAPEQSEAVKAVLELIAALPTMAELEAVDTEGEGFADYLAKLRFDTAAARTAYDALTDEEKASFDPAVLEKLTALEAVLAAMPVLMAATTVTTWAELITAIKNAPTDGTETTITISGTIDSKTGSTIILLSGQNIVIDGGKVEGEGKLLFRVENSELTLKNFHVDGQNKAARDAFIIQNSKNGTLTIGEGCVFENINFPVSSYRSVIISNFGDCSVTGGTFRNNTSENIVENGFSSVGIYNASNLTITGGTFSNNRHNGTGLGAAVYNTSIAMCYISGGTFDSRNVAAKNNAGIFHSSQSEDASGEMHLSGDPAINCPLFLDAGTADKFIYLDGALTGNVTLKPAKYEENYVLVKAAQGYTLTNDDYLNIKLLQPESGTWYTKLSTDGTSIMATEEVGDRLATVYLAPVNGVDTNNGTTAAMPIKTFDKAKQLLANGGKIILVPPVTITSDELWELPNGTFGGATVTDDGKVIITVGNGGSLNLGDVTIDGIDRIEVESGGSVTIGDATVIKPESGGKTDIVVDGGGTLEIGKDTDLANIDKIYTTGGGTVNDNGNTNAGGKTDSTTTPPVVTDPPPAIECTCVAPAIYHMFDNKNQETETFPSLWDFPSKGVAVGGSCAVADHMTNKITYTYSFVSSIGNNTATVAPNATTPDTTTLSFPAADIYTMQCIASSNGKETTGTADFTITAPVPVPGKITVTVTEGTTTKTVGGESLSDAIKKSTLTAGAITKLTITAGKVTLADWEWLKKLTSLTHFTIADTIVNGDDASIPNGAMDSPIFPKSIVAVSIPQAITVGAYAFLDCSNLTTVSLPKATKIGIYAFHNCVALTTVEVPKATTIGDDAFYNCKLLTEVRLPNATTIGSSAFKYCKALTTVELPKVTTIEISAFEACGALTTVSLPAVTSIDGDAFIYCSKLTTVSLPKATKIGSAAFRYCNKLATLKLGATPPTVGYTDVFENCLKTTLTLVGTDGITELTGDTLTNAQAEYDKVVSPDTGTATDGLWYGWKVREGIVVCTCTLSAPTFAGASITIPADQANATHTLSASGSILGGNCTVSGHSNATVSYSFAEKTDDSNIASITGKNLNVTGAGIVVVTATATANGKTATKEATFTVTKAVVADKITITVSDGTTTKTVGGASLEAAVTAAKGTGGSYTDFSTLTITAGEVTRVDWEWLNMLYNLERFEIADTIEDDKVAPIPATPIDSGEFLFPTGIVGVTIPQAITIGERAFFACTKLTAVSFDKATSIGKEAFEQCSMLKDITTTFQNVQTIGEGAFAQCSALEKVSFPQVTRINKQVFEDCILLKTASITSATSIAANAFRNCEKLTLEGTSFPAVTDIGDRAFSSCNSLVNVIFPKAKTIGKEAFSGCINLISASFPVAESFSNGEGMVFNGSKKFATLKLGKTVPKVGEYAFSNCPAIDKLVLVGADGITELTGDTLTTAQAAYDNVTTHGNTTTDGKWYGWKVREPVAVCTCVLSAPTFAGASITIPADQANATHTLSATGSNLSGSCTLVGHSSATVSYSYAEKTDASNIASIAGNILTVTGAGSVVVTATATANGKTATADAIFTVTKAVVADKITITVTYDTTTKTDIGGTSLSDAVTKALGTYHVNAVKTLKITAGEVTAADWEYFAGGTPGTTGSLFKYMETFEIDAKVTKVDNIPNGGDSNSIFPASIKTVTIPQKIAVGDYAFQNCGELSTASLPEATAIGNYAFGSCSKLATVKFNKVTSIGNAAFGSCTSLVSVSLPKVTGIGVSAFSGCTSLATLQLPKDPPSAGSSAFYDCLKTTLTLVGADGTTELTGETLTTAQAAYDKVADGIAGSTDIDGLWYGWKVREPIATCTCVISAPTFTSNSIVIPADQASTTYALQASGSALSGSCTMSGHGGTAVIYSFAEKTDDSNIASIVGSTLTVTGAGTVIITATATANGKTATTDASFTVTKAVVADKITIKISDGTTIKTVGGATLEEAIQTSTVSNITKLEIVSGTLTANDWNTIKNVSTLKELDIKAGVAGSDIPNGLSGGGTNLTNLTTIKAADAKTIGSEAFYALTGLTTIDFPNVETIESYAFYYTGITEAIFPKVKSIGEKGITDPNNYSFVFASCSNLKTVEFKTAEYIAPNSFENCVKLETAFFPMVKEIGSSAFQNTATEGMALTTADFRSVEKIGANAFEGCKYFNSLKLDATPPNTVGANAFISAPATRSLTLVDASGNALTGTALTNVQAIYDAVTTGGGTATDGLWYGWKVREAAPTCTCVLSAPTFNDSISSIRVDQASINLVLTAKDSTLSGNCTLTGHKMGSVSYSFAEKTDDSNIASITGKNLNVTGAGIVVVTATATANGKTATKDATFTIIQVGTPIAVTGVSLNKATLSLEAGKSETLVATISPATATNKAVTWKTSNTGIATVDQSGKITAVAVGSATITVTTTDGGKTATCAVTVTPAAIKPAPGGQLDTPLTQEKVDGVFGEGNATLDGTTTPPTITIKNDITVKEPIEIKTDVTIDLGGNTITGDTGKTPIIVGDNNKVTIGGGGTVSGGDNSGGTGGNGITGGTGSDITISVGTTVEGGDGTIGGDGINSSGNVTVDGSVNGGNGSGGNGGDGVDTSTGGGNITIKPDGSANGGDSTGGNGSGGNGTSSGGNTVVGGDVTGGNGNGSGNGGNGSASNGSGSITVENGGTANGGNGGTGTATGGNGGNGTDTSGGTTVNGGATGGNGGHGNGNGSGGAGGNGANQGSGTVGGNGTATGGNGGNGAGTGNGGSGGAGVGGGAGAGSVTAKPGANGRKATAEVDDSKSGTTVTVPDEFKLADAALTEAEKKDPAITEVNVVLNVEKKNNQPDKAEIDRVLSSQAADTIGAFFDITLDKIITNADGVQPPVGVTNTSEEVEITITIPSDMRGGSNYVVIRVHNGTGAALSTTQSGDDLTFKTDKFSTYAIAYTKAGGTTPPTPPSGGGSGGSGSGGGKSPSAGTPFDKPNTPTTAETEVKAEVDKNGNAAVTLPVGTIEAAVQKAVDEAKKAGKTGNGIAVLVNVSTDGKNAGSMSVILPKATQEYIISNKVSQITFVVKNPAISIGLNLAAVTEINRQAQADVQLTATRLTSTAGMSAAAQTAIGTRPVFALSATYQNGTKAISNIGSGRVMVTIPYTLSAKENPGSLYGVYTDENGIVHYLTESSYHANSKAVILSASHFRTYGVGYKAIAFTDIDGHWAKDDIEFVANRGLLSGIDTNIFSPNTAMTREMFVTALGRMAGIDSTKYKNTTVTPDQSITRQEMAVIMQKYAEAMGYTVPKTRSAVTFADNGSIASGAKDAVKTMQMAGIISGKDGNRFDPAGAATRAEAAAVLRRYIELMIDTQTAQGWDKNDSGSAMYYQNGKALTGNQEVEGKTYAFNSYGEVQATLLADKETGIHIVQKGEYFYSIAKKYGVSVEALMAANGKKTGDVIYPGETLKIPQ